MSKASSQSTSHTHRNSGRAKQLARYDLSQISCLQCRSKGNISGGARERRRREPLEGSGGMLPQKILNSRGLEMPFPALSKSYL